MKPLKVNGQLVHEGRPNNKEMSRRLETFLWKYAHLPHVRPMKAERVLSLLRKPPRPDWSSG